MGAKVIGGTVNRTGALRFEATQVGKDTALSQIIRLVEDAQASKAPIQKIADLVAGNFILGVHLLSLLVFLFWFFVGYGAFFTPDSRFILSPNNLAAMGVFGFSLLLSISVLVISCPCAVGLATPERHDGRSRQGRGVRRALQGRRRPSRPPPRSAPSCSTRPAPSPRGNPTVTDVLPGSRG